jgi:membrane-bound metal-dependent hydrolase YbcI (DUF457 family)
VFIGHFAVGFAAKRAAPRASLAALLLAALFADVLWPVLLAVGAEEVRIAPGDTVYTPLEFVSYPWSHSLLMLIVWGGFFAAYYRNRPGGRRTGLIAALVVVSHWVLDWITHRADMPLWPRGPRLGLALWNSVAGTMTVEIAMFVIGVVIYARSTRARDRIGSVGLWAFVVLLLGYYVFGSINRTPPPSIQAIWISAPIATAIILIWAGWFDRHRNFTGPG